MKTQRLILLLFTLAIFIVSCKKDKEDNNVASSSDEAVMDFYWTDIIRQVYLAAGQMDDSIFGAKSSNIGSSFNVPDLNFTPADQNTWPKQVEVYWGDMNMDCSDGRRRRGSIRFTMSGRHLDSLTIYTIEPHNYFINDVYVEMLMVQTCLGRVNSVYDQMSVDVSGAKVVTGNGTIFWESQRYMEFRSGFITPWPVTHDDTFVITGHAEGTNVEEVGFFSDVVDSLYWNLSCPWITKGTLEVKPSGKNPRLLDFGYENEGCDPDAQITIGEEYFKNIRMP